MTTPHGDDTPTPTLKELSAQMTALSAQLDFLVRRQESMADLTAELTPVVKQAIDGMGERLEALEEKGYVTFGRELLRVLDKVVQGFSEEDLRQLGDNVVNILETVRSVTQPDVMNILHEATNAIHEGDVEQSGGIFSMLKASRDKDVRSGMGVMLGMLRHVGKAAKTISSKNALGRRRPGLAKALAPSRRTRKLESPLQAARKAARKSAAEAAPATPAAAVVDAPTSIGGVAVDSKGFLVDSKAWTKDVAIAMAAHLNVEMTPAHWEIIDHARATWSETNVAANVRKLAKGAGVTTRDLYGLFPRAPAKTVARIAGTPKPVGCI